MGVLFNVLLWLGNFDIGIYNNVSGVGCIESSKSNLASPVGKVNDTVFKIIDTAIDMAS